MSAWVERRTGAIAYHESGAGSAAPPVVLLHGFLSSGRQWRLVSERHPALHLLAPDMPGFGLSELPSQRQRLGDYVDALEGWAERLGLSRIALVGHSFGGLVALAWAIRSPARASRLGLIAPAGVRHDWRLPPTWPLRVPGLRWLFVQLLAARPIARRIFGGIVAGGPEAFDRPGRGGEQTPYALEVSAFLWSVRHAREAFRSPGFYDVPDLARRLAAIAVPVFLLWGDADRVLPVADAAIFAQHLAHCHLEVLPGCGHAPHVERPAEFDRFLLRVAGQSSIDGSGPSTESINNRD